MPLKNRTAHSNPTLPFWPSSFINSPSKGYVYISINFQVASKMPKRLNQQLMQPQLPQCCMLKPMHLHEHNPYFLSWIPSADVVLWNSLNAISIPVQVTCSFHYFLFCWPNGAKYFTQYVFSTIGTRKDRLRRELHK